MRYLIYPTVAPIWLSDKLADWPLSFPYYDLPWSSRAKGILISWFSHVPSVLQVPSSVEHLIYSRIEHPLGGASVRVACPSHVDCSLGIADLCVMDLFMQWSPLGYQIRIVESFFRDFDSLGTHVCDLWSVIYCMSLSPIKYKDKMC